MTLITPALIGLLTLILTVVLTSFLRRYALSRQLIDIPNSRSSHSTPTPRGGGVAIVLVFLIGLPILSKLDIIPISTLWALLGAGTGSAVIGFLDDHGHIPARWRLLAHFSSATWGLYCLGGFPPLLINLPFGYEPLVFNLGWLGQLLGLFYLVWLLNLYNFMDGIDGLASLQAITTCIGGALLYVLTSENYAPALLPLLLASAVSGFLIWNFPPAKIFMGDACSGFLGLILGLFSIQAAWLNPLFLWSWLILLGVFIVDATLTLLRRFLQGEKVYEAHRSHAYQYASRYYKSHKKVSITVSLINMLWLMPLALWVGLSKLNPFVGLILAYLPLLLLAMYFNAGQREHK